MEYIDPSKIFAIRDFNTIFSSETIENKLQDILNKNLTKITIDKKVINKIKRLGIIENSNMNLFIDSGKFLMYLFIKDDVLDKLTSLGISKEYGNFRSIYERPISVYVNFPKFAEMLNYFNDELLEIDVYDGKSPIIVKGKEKIGIIAPSIIGDD